MRKRSSVYSSPTQFSQSRSKPEVDKVSEVCQQLGMEISTAYEAFWFLHDHPKFVRLERDEISRKQAREDKKDKDKDKWNIFQDEGGNYWREWKVLTRHAIKENLDIYYAKVDDTGRINDDPLKNIHQECWLEFGSVEWGYHSDGEASTGMRAYEMHYHDVDLDCGAPTFDEALVELANLVLKKYGPIHQK